MYKHFLKTALPTLLVFGFTHAQEKQKDSVSNIGTTVVNVVKAYNPTISDAFKAKEFPSLNDSVTTTKKDIEYTIFSIPVASTFIPTKGDPSRLKGRPKEKLYNSYVSLGLGNYSTALLDFYTSRAIGRDEKLDISLNHHSSQGKIKGLQAKDRFFNSKLEGFYRKKNRYLDWGATAGFAHKLYNWYGFAPEFQAPITVIEQVEKGQNYYDAFASGYIASEDFYIPKAEISLRRFWDTHNSEENRATIAPSFEFPIAKEYITTKVHLDYLGTQFNRSLEKNQKQEYHHLIGAVQPGLQVFRKNLTVDLGANITYHKDFESKQDRFHMYPKINATYKPMDAITIFAGVEGGLKQNSFHGFVAKNPFVAPVLQVKPTDTRYDTYLGFKGKIISNIGYTLKGGYVVANDKPLYRLATHDTGSIYNNNKGYMYANAYDVVYDDVKTLSILAEIAFDISRYCTISVRGEYFDYTLQNQLHAWNLPQIKAGIFADYQITKKWYAGANIFYTGTRKDMLRTTTSGVALEDAVHTEVLSLKAFFDANIHIRYRFNSKLSAFARGNNLTNTRYMRFVHTPVQQIQVLAGVSYQFNF